MNNKAVLYLRLSKEDRNKVNKGDDSESIINQRIMLSNYAMRHNFQVVKIYSDDDESGTHVRDRKTDFSSDDAGMQRE
ncbi:MAG: recombinase family protein [Anaerobutyricum hallii]